MRKFLVSLALIALLSLACQTITNAVVTSPTQTLAPPTPTPKPDFGVPVSSGAWQISLNEARTAPSLVMGQTTITPKGDYAFLIVDMSIRYLDPTRKMTITLDNVAILDANKSIHTANGGGWGESSICAGCAITLSKDAGASSISVSAILLSGTNISFTSTTIPSGQPISFVFVLNKNLLDDEWQLQFQDIPPIPFKLGDKASYSVKTEISPQDSFMPHECQAENMQAAQKQSGLIYQDWQDNKLAAKLLLLDKDSPLDLCSGFAYNSFETEPNGGMLLTAGPLQGWSNFYLIEPDGKVVSLVRNALTVDGDFIPATKYALVSVTRIGETKDELYLYDRESGAMSLLYEGRWINYRIFPNGDLMVNGMPADTFEQFTYMGPVGAEKLPELKLPDGAYSGDITSDGKHLFRTDYEGGGARLYLTNLDGSDKKEIKAEYISYASKLLSPDGKYVLLQIKGKAENMEQVSLYDLATDTAQSITPDGDNLKYSFSPDGKWVAAISTFKREESDKAKTRKQTLYLFDTGSKKVVKEIKGEIVNYLFSPDGASLAYTILNEDETLDMFLLNLSDNSQRQLGKGILAVWSK